MDPGSQPVGPITGSERILSLDVLRGVAVLGILVMNIQCFSMIGQAYMNPTAYGDLEAANWWVWYLGHLFTDQKFMAIFSMLFGAGVVVMTSRREADGHGSAGAHYSRMCWLLLFGLLHAYLLWYGDILYSYAVCGFVLWPLRKLPSWALLALGMLTLCVASGISIGSDSVCRCGRPRSSRSSRLRAGHRRRRSWRRRSPHTAAVGGSR